MRVSLVVATINRIKPLRRLLKSLETQRHRDFTVFLADQNSSGYLDEVLSEFAHLPIAVTRMLPRGVSAARNSVLTQADGDIIAFPDDDCLYQPDTLSQVVEFFPVIRNTEVFWVTGRISELHRTGQDAL